MANEVLVQRVKAILAAGKAQGPDAAYAGYGELFASPEFAAFRPEDRRQALRLMVLAKSAPRQVSEAMRAAHVAAVEQLTELVSTFGEPSDHELLGVAHLLLGHDVAASSIMRAGLAIERERNPQSDLCGELMKRVSLI